MNWAWFTYPSNLTQAKIPNPKDKTQFFFLKVHVRALIEHQYTTNILYFLFITNKIVMLLFTFDYSYQFVLNLKYINNRCQLRSGRVWWCDGGCDSRAVE